MQENEANEQSGFGKYDELQSKNVMEQFVEEPIVNTLPEKQEKKSIKDKLYTMLFLIIIVGLAAWFLWSGIRGLLFANSHPMDDVFINAVKGDVYEGDITLASKEYCALKHTVNFVPAGTEHFYLLYSPGMDMAISLRAQEDWDESFGNDIVNEISLNGRGIVRELDYEVKQELSSIVSLLETEGIHVEQNLYIDLTANKMCCMQIFEGFSLILCIIYFSLRFYKKTESASYSRPITIAMIVLLMVTLGMVIYLLNMVGI